MVDAALDSIGLLDEGLGTGTVATPATGKLRFVSPSAEQYQHLLDQLRSQLSQRRGDVVISVGLGDDGETSGLSDDDLEASLDTLQALCRGLEADMSRLRSRKEDGGTVQEFLVRERAQDEDFQEVRVAVLGNVDSGKSTLLGVLTHGDLDNGRGKSRMKLFKHKHEADSGRTSAISHDILGFSSSGEIVNAPVQGKLDWPDMCTKASKVVTFIDLAGHERYLKTTVFGLTGHAPDFAMLMVGGNAGVQSMTKEHLGLTLGLNVPVFVVVTKIDMAPPNVLADNLSHLQKVLKSPGCRKIPILVSSMDDVIVAATNFQSERVCPIFQVSNVTGENLDLLKMFLNLLTTTVPSTDDEDAVFQIDDSYSVPGVGTVVSGTVLSGVITVTDTLLLGPDQAGHFHPVALKGIHRHRLPTSMVRGGQMASFALKKVKRHQVRKGMVMMSSTSQPQAVREFEGEVVILHHPTTISVGYQAMLHCGSIKQTASIVGMSQDTIRTGDRAKCRFRFFKNSEFLRAGTRFVFRDGRTKGVGTVVRLLSSEDAQVAEEQPKRVPQAKTRGSRRQRRQERQSKHSHLARHVSGGTATGTETAKTDGASASASTAAATQGVAAMTIASPAAPAARPG
eukprot:m.19690 g.19690  ORF g.19690 m.19690 type:complete len:624 (+) comp5999_c0_seq1:713-2584(+)